MKTLKLLIAGMIFLIMSSSAWSYGSTGMWSSPDFFEILIIQIVMELLDH